MPSILPWRRRRPNRRPRPIGLNDIDWGFGYLVISSICLLVSMASIVAGFSDLAGLLALAPFVLFTVGVLLWPIKELIEPSNPDF
ncbi:hypothetical protein CKO28_20490 [Rhodovibrio sodomensis]|uniref:Uncharacterized protein n=1 Tax=Rhodovibrio sodomensis TaxID=1088 RepID=A0ABS1DK93_9PROT|nr:hypothetical protein [Rhodovibrio sodomensis]MBK1670406.1 hypothetical protein [Rhodovibrio sodomensis]